MRNHPQDQTIAEPMEVEFVDAEGVAPARTVMASFVYDSADPFAVGVEFDLTPKPISWLFARELLIDGYYGPQGEGDVQIFPFLDRSGTSVIAVALRSQDGESFFQVNAREVNAFIQRMLELVPLGTEGSPRDLDVELQAVLAGATLAGPARPDLPRS